MAAARAAQCRRRPRRPVRLAEARRRRGAARARAAAPSGRFLHQVGRRHPRAAISATSWSRPCSASTPSSAIMPAPMRRAAPMSCSTTSSARRRGWRAPGATRSAAWARSPRRWPRRRARRASRSSSTRRSKRSSSSSGRAAGAVAGGKAYRAKAVVAGVHPKLLFTEAAARGRGRGRAGPADGALGERIGDLPDERRFVGAAALHLAAGAGRPPHRRDHRGAVARLYGPRLSDRANRRLLAGSRSSRC